jgi:hypothetical protein
LQQGSCCLADVGGARASTPEELAQKLAEASKGDYPVPTQAELQPFDHVLTPVGASVASANAELWEHRAAAVVLYGAIGTECFRRMHAIILSAAEKGPFRNCCLDQLAQSDNAFAYSSVLHL